MGLVSPEPFDYEIQETDDFVTGDIELETRFFFRADRYAARLNRYRRVPFYRYEVFRENRRWVVVAMQNVLVRKQKDDDRPNAS
jgi:hypothetical protein